MSSESAETLPMWIEAITGVAIAFVTLVAWLVRQEFRQGANAEKLESHKATCDKEFVDIKAILKEVQQKHLDLDNKLMEKLLDIEKTLAKICAVMDERNK